MQPIAKDAKPTQASTSLADLFQEHRHRPWAFLRPLGNWGDNLIFAGAETMADRLGVSWTSYETPQFRTLPITPEHCIYLQGGGGYNAWSSGRAFVNLELALASPAHLVIQGPVSTSGDTEWLRNRMKPALSQIACRSFVFLAREPLTLGVLRDLDIERTGAKLGIDCDTALALTAADLLAIAQLESMPAGNYDLVVLREDNEQDGAAESTLASVAGRSAGVALDPAYVAKSFGHWLRIHLYARSITTNRLHSSIVGAIAGKPVSIGPGSYHKNRSVWEYSLHNLGVRWVDGIRPPRAVLWNLLPNWVRNSYKVGQMRLAVHRIPLW